MTTKSRLAPVLALCLIAPLSSAQSARLVAVRAAQMFDAKAGPLADITQLESVRFVIKGGEVVKNELR